MLLLAALIVTTLPLTSSLSMTAQAISDCDNHSWGAWEVTIEPTCIAWGTRVRRCENCLAEEIEDLRPTGQHRFEVTPRTQETPATCTQAGSRTLYCGVCGESKEEKIPALGHALDGGTVTKEAGCTEAGVKTFNCTRCGHTETEQIAALGHNHQTITTKEAACTAEGEKETKCLRCGESTKEKIPALGHNHQETVTKQATCTEAGEKETKCTRCGDSKKTEIAALGHDWDRSETKEPEGFTDGEAVAKCRRCGETEKQVISAAAAVLNKLRNGGKATTRDNTEKYDPLKIVEQSTGDFFVNIGTDESVTLSVKAEGGVEPYTYIWHEVPIPGFHYGGGGTHKRNLSANVSKLMDVSAGTYTDIVSKAADAYRANAKKAGGSLNARRQRLSADVRHKKNGEIVYHNAESQQKASRGGRYWYCVVEDAAGNQAMSENIWVFYYPYLIQQPENVNVHNGPATTAFVASGGSQEFYYEWYDAKDGTRISEAQTDGSITLDKPGEYYCEAINIDLNEPWRSDTIRAYDTPPLSASAAKAEYEFDPAKDKEITIQFSFRGGMPGNYTIRHSVNGTVKEEYTKKLSMGRNRSKVERFTVSERESDADVHTITVTDEAGETASAQCTVVAPKLKIKTQPEGGYLNSSKRYKLSIEMENGEPENLVYTLYLTNKDGDGRLQMGDSKRPRSRSCSLEIWQPGRFYIEVFENGSGRRVQSDTVVVRGDVVRIVKQTTDQVIENSRDVSTLAVIVEGGEAPYKACWEVKPILPGGSYADSYYTLVPNGWSEDVRRHSGEYTAMCNAYGQGIFRCTVTDANGQTAAAEIRVESKGKEPRIIQQPENVTLSPDINGNYSTRLVCIAESVTGDNSGLSYYWYKWFDHGGKGEWFRYDPGTGSTGMFYNLSGLSGDRIGGFYKCRVYDEKTGKDVYSYTVEVQTELEIKLTETDDNSTSIPFVITGGEAPYQVTAYLGYIYGRDESNWDGMGVPLYFHTYLTAYGGPFTYKNRSYYGTVLVSAIENRKYEHNYPATFCPARILRVRDAGGREVTVYVPYTGKYKKKYNVENYLDDIFDFLGMSEGERKRAMELYHTDGGKEKLYAEFAEICEWCVK